jgi:hypothetical protein
MTATESLGPARRDLPPLLLDLEATAAAAPEQAPQLR